MRWFFFQILEIADKEPRPEANLRSLNTYLIAVSQLGQSLEFVQKVSTAGRVPDESGSNATLQPMREDTGRGRQGIGKRKDGRFFSFSSPLFSCESTHKTWNVLFLVEKNLVKHILTCFLVNKM